MAKLPRTGLDRLALAKLGAVAIVVFGLGMAALLVRAKIGQLAVAWPANAVVVAVLIRSRTRLWPSILAAAFVGALGADIVVTTRVAASFVLSATDVLEAFLCALAMHRLTGGDVDLSRPSDLRIFAAVAGVGAPLIPACLSVAFVHTGPDAPWNQIVSWWSTDVMGLLIITPALLALTPASLRHLGHSIRTRWGATSAVFLAASLAMAFGQHRYPVIFLIPTALIFIAFELGQAGAALALLVTAIFSVSLAVSGHSTAAMSHLSFGAALMALQMFLATMTLLVLPVSAALAQRRRLQEEVARQRDEAELIAAKLAASESHYKLIADGVMDLIVRYDQNGIIQYISPSVRQFGFEPEDVVGRNVADFEEPKFRASTRKNLASYSAGQPFIDGRMGETKIRVADGRQIWLEGTPSAVYSDDGAFRGIVMVMRDVTARRALEAELQAKTVAAQAASEAKSEFLANMSHEIRTPLTGIIGFAELLATAQDMPPRATQFVDKIATSSKALLSVVNDVLDFSKLEAGQVEIDPQPFNVTTFLEDTVDLVRDQAAHKALSVDIEIEDAIPGRLIGDSARLRQVLLNLLTNAVKFTDTGAITVELGYRARNERLRIAVRDTGHGVPVELADRLFRRFSQVDGSNARQHGGTGLGLAISKGLAELMGGDIGVKSEVGVGSTFWFTVKAPVAPAVAVAEPVDAQDDPAVARTRILLVDDVANNRDLVMAFLSPFDIQFVEAANGSEAVAASLRSQFDLILMDLQMPGMDGLAATAAIRANSALNATTPILALSANVLPQQVEACLRAGMNDHIGKPINLRDLLSKIAWWTSEAARETAKAAAQAQAG